MSKRIVFTKTPINLTKVSIYMNGRWNPSILQSPTKTTPTLSYFQIDYKFGLVASTQSDPSKIKLHGNPGDYVTRNNENNLSIVTPAQFHRLFPKKDITPPYRGVTSQELSDPNYLAKTVREPAENPSNKIQVGTASFKMEAKTTFKIIDTPTGLAQVSVPLDASAYNLEKPVTEVTQQDTTNEDGTTDFPQFTNIPYAP